MFASYKGMVAAAVASALLAGSMILSALGSPDDVGRWILVAISAYWTAQFGFMARARFVKDKKRPETTHKQA